MSADAVTALSGTAWQTTVVGTDNYIKVLPNCPAGGSYSVACSADTGANVTCTKSGNTPPHILPENVSSSATPAGGGGDNP